MRVDGDRAVLSERVSPWKFSSAMAELAQSLRTHHTSVDEMLALIGGAALANIAGASSAGISLRAERGRLETRSATDELPALVADVQSQTGEGPCQDCIDRRSTVRVDDLAAESRWPAFTGRLTAQALASMLSAPLLIAGRALGSLSVYSDQPRVFDADSEELAQVLARHAAVAIAGAREEEGLLLALDSRDLIGQAKGILMERHKVTSEQAFQMLVHVSQAHNVKLRDIAAQVAATGQLDQP